MRRKKSGKKQLGRFTLCNSVLALSEAEGSSVLRILNC